MPGAHDTLPIRVFKNQEQFGESEAASGPEVSMSLGSRGFMAGPPGLTVQLDHGVAPGAGRLRG